MRVLIDIVHPADVLFFKRPIEGLIRRGNDVLILSRKKDVACELLDDFGFKHRPVSQAGKGVLGLGVELIRRDFSVLKAAKQFKPDVMVGFGGVSISHVGKLLGIPSVSFYDSENASLQNRLTWPFISRLYVPQAYRGHVPEERTYRLPGTKELSYLHPASFKKDAEIARKAGWDPKADNFFVRTVGWTANHDITKSGWDETRLRQVVNYLQQRGRVHISSERVLPADLEALRYQGSISDVHHLMAHCKLLVGESATMASEAAILGVPAVYNGQDFPGYVEELSGVGLITNLPGDNSQAGWVALEAAMQAYLVGDLLRVQKARDEYVKSSCDWGEAVIEALESMFEKNGSDCSSETSSIPADQAGVKK